MTKKYQDGTDGVKAALKGNDRLLSICEEVAELIAKAADNRVQCVIVMSADTEVIVTGTAGNDHDPTSLLIEGLRVRTGGADR